MFSGSFHLKHPGQQLPQQEQEVMVVVGPYTLPLHPQPWTHHLPHLHKRRADRRALWRGTKSTNDLAKF